MSNARRIVLARTIGAIALASVGAGCTVEPWPSESTRTATARIQGGTTDANDTNVVVIANLQINELCSGSLIGPNLVLTAAHCVQKSAITTGASCSAFVFDGTTDPANLLFSNATTVPLGQSSYAKVVEAIALPQPGETLCDRDVALVVLQDPVDTTATPLLVPRVDESATAGEPFTATGYGQSGGGLGIGTRRTLGGLSVACTGACGVPYAGDIEWIGHPSVAHTGGRPGDSGSPALDALGRVMGVFVRHREYPAMAPTPDELVYSSVTNAADFIEDGAIHAAMVGGYDPPAWASGYPTDPAFSFPIGGPCDETCASGLCARDECTRRCNDAAPCPGGTTCEADASGVDVCTPPAPAPAPKKADDGSCALRAAPGPHDAAPLAAFTVLAVAAIRRRRSSAVRSRPR